MDPFSIAMMAFGMIDVALKAATQFGLLGNTADVAKYVTAGLTIAAKATTIIQESRHNPSKYDAMTPEEIRALLKPEGWDDAEARVKAELGL